MISQEQLGRDILDFFARLHCKFFYSSKHNIPQVILDFSNLHYHSKLHNLITRFQFGQYLILRNFSTIVYTLIERRGIQKVEDEVKESGR